MHLQAAGRLAGGWLVEDALGQDKLALLHMVSHAPEGRSRPVLMAVFKSKRVSGNTCGLFQASPLSSLLSRWPKSHLAKAGVRIEEAYKVTGHLMWARGEERLGLLI